jgi:hypothetical protein
MRKALGAIRGFATEDGSRGQRSVAFLSPWHTLDSICKR